MFNEVQNEKIKTVAENFCNTYFNCWKEAMKDKEGIAKYKCVKDPETNEGLLKGWTDFHMRKILYVLAEELGGYKYKTKSCGHNDECTKCEHHEYGTREYRCDYGKGWQQEYYNVDLLLSKYQLDSDSNVGKWCNDFYIEHENAHFRLHKDDANKVQKKGWFDEFNKLLPLNTSDDGMRVIISYDDFDMVEEKGKFLLEHLNDPNSLTQKSIVKKPILVILAPSINAINSGEDKWCFHILLFTFDNEWKCDYEEPPYTDQKIKVIFEQIKTR